MKSVTDNQIAVKIAGNSQNPLIRKMVSKQCTVKFEKHCLSSPLYRTPVYFMNDYLNHSLETIELVSLFSQETT